MSTLKFLTAELWHRKMNVTLSLFALVAAATLFVAGPTLLEGYQRESQARLDRMNEETAAALTEMQQETGAELARMEQQADQDLEQLNKRTRRIMRDLGFNLRIVHKNTDMTRLYADFVALDMPEEYITTLAESPTITKIVHLVATLRQMIEVDGKPRLLVGFAPEATQSHIEKKPPMGFRIQQGTVYLGAVAGEGRSVDDSIEVLGHSFRVARILEPHGSEEDIAICMHLKDAQKVLDKPGRISEILALGCKCETIDRVEEITEQLEAVLPEAKVTEHRLQAIAREDQRKLVEQHHAQTMENYQRDRGKIVQQERDRRQQIVRQERDHRASVMGLLSALISVVTPLVILVCAIWVGMLAWSNVRERRPEIGLLRAIGKGSTSIAALFLGKAALLGAAAGLVGCGLGYLLARWMATGVLDVAADHFTPSLLASVCAVLGTPLVAAMASYLPTLSALNQDPAVVLMEA